MNTISVRTYPKAFSRICLGTAGFGNTGLSGEPLEQAFAIRQPEVQCSAPADLIPEILVKECTGKLLVLDFAGEERIFSLQDQE